MTLTDQQKKYITDILESKYFKDTLYQGLEDKEKRKALGQVYTSAAVCIKLIELYKTSEFSDNNILDPCCGSGNLLIAMLAAGADSDKLYGNDYDEAAVRICKVRINAAIDKLNEWNAYGINSRSHIKDYQIHQGNALQTRCLTEFSDTYDRNYNPEFIDDLTYAQSVDKYGRPVSWEEDNKNHQKFIQVDLFSGLF